MERQRGDQLGVPSVLVIFKIVPPPFCCLLGYLTAQNLYYTSAQYGSESQLCCCPCQQQAKARAAISGRLGGWLKKVLYNDVTMKKYYLIELNARKKIQGGLAPARPPATLQYTQVVWYFYDT